MRVEEGVGHACRACSSGLELWARAPGYSEGQEGHHRGVDQELRHGKRGGSGSPWGGLGGTRVRGTDCPPAVNFTHLCPGPRAHHGCSQCHS